MDQPDQLGGSTLHQAHPSAVSQGFPRLLAASSLCNCGQEHNQDKQAEFRGAPEDVFKPL
jgi:hypothetical protein